MSPFSSCSKAIGSLISRRNSIRHLVKFGKKSGPISYHPNPISVQGISQFPTDANSTFCSSGRRKFFGCNDSVLSKIYEEKRVLGYSPEQLYNVVAAVDLYQDFLPWCQRSQILKQHHNDDENDESFDAELEIGFNFFVESYVSRVELIKPKRVKTTALDTTLFHHLINIWEFNPGPVQGSCNVYFLVDFKFQSPLYGKVASMFFKDVVSRLVGSFNERCRIIYGPATRVLE
ncbi:hypothetical protein CsatB_013785 [Cannabis sativa]